MAIPSKQIGWGTEENLLWQISKQLESLTGVTNNSKQTLLNVYNPNSPLNGAKIETFSGAWNGFTRPPGDPLTPAYTILSIDTSLYTGAILDYSGSTGHNDTSTGSLVFTFNSGVYQNAGGEVTIGNGGVDFDVSGNLISFWYGGDSIPVEAQVLYTIKLYTVPLYND
jgi:hypothetical protein